MSAILWPLFLLAATVAFIFLELFIPSGGALGFLAIVAAIASMVVAFTNGGPLFGTIWLTFSGIVLPVVTALAIRWWPHTPLGRLLFNLPSPRDVDEAAGDLKILMGKRGTAKSIMLPAGAVLIEGKTFAAVTEWMPIEAGQDIEVSRVEGNRIVVRPVTESHKELDVHSDDILARPIDSLGLDDLGEPLT